jgi:xylulokinase
MTAGPFLLGIDVGTTTCRSAVVDLDGRILGTAQRETVARYPRPSWAEVDPETWWNEATTVVREAILASNVSAHDIAAAGISGLMHAPVLLGADDRPVWPAMLWMDQRCASQVPRLRETAVRLGRAAEVPLSTTFTAPKLAWLAECQPDVLAASQRLLLPKDYIRYRLTGVDGTDPSDAFGTGLYDARAGDWMWDMVDALDVPRRLMPAIRPAHSLAGPATHAAAAETGLCPDTPVAVGGGDALCSRLGSGWLGPDEVCLYLGTAAWLAPAQFERSRDGGARMGFGSTTATGAALRWLRDAFAAPVDYARLVDGAEDATAGAEGLFFLPHLMGERGPADDPLARGALVGLTLRHGYQHIARAVLEGTVFQLRRVLDAHIYEPRMAPAHSRGSGVASGGVARSAVWMQLIADVTGLTLRVNETVESGVLGAATLAAAAVNLVPLEVAQRRMARVARTYTPDAERAEAYEAIYSRYCALDDLLDPWFGSASDSAPVRAAPSLATHGIAD